MTNLKELAPYNSPRAFYGAELRRKREEAGLSQEALGEKVFCSGSYIGQFEAGTRRPQPDISMRIDAVLGTDGLFVRLCELARQSKHADYFADAAELEKQAESICEYAPSLVPGILQTEAYFRALWDADAALRLGDDLDEKVQARMERTRLLDDATGPVLWAILHEAILRVPVGGPAVMVEQLGHIVDVGRRGRILVQVLPFSAGAYAATKGMFSIMTFTDAPTVFYTEGQYSGQLLDDPPVVARTQAAYDLLRAAALSPEASLDLIESVAEAYRHEL